MIYAYTVAQMSCIYVDASLHVYLQYTLLILCLLPASSFSSCRLSVSCRGRQSVGLKVNFLLKDPCENELCSDNWERCRDSRATQWPVLLAGNHYSLQLRKSQENEIRNYNLDSGTSWKNDTAEYHNFMLIYQSVNLNLNWYLVRWGHLRKEGSSTARDYIFHLNWLWFYRFCNMDLISLTEKEKILCSTQHVWFCSVFIYSLQERLGKGFWCYMCILFPQFRRISITWFQTNPFAALRKWCREGRL